MRFSYINNFGDLLKESRAGILKRAFEIIAVAALACGLCGAIFGLLVGVFAPGIASGLYALDGDPPPRSWSPAQAGFRTGAGLGSACGAVFGSVLAIVAVSWPQLLLVRLRSLMVAVALCAMVLWIFTRSLK
jgi:hypothetical protein